MSEKPSMIRHRVMETNTTAEKSRTKFGQQTEVNIQTKISTKSLTPKVRISLGSILRFSNIWEAKDTKNIRSSHGSILPFPNIWEGKDTKCASYK